MKQWAVLNPLMLFVHFHTWYILCGKQIQSCSSKFGLETRKSLLCQVLGLWKDRVRLWGRTENRQTCSMLLHSCRNTYRSWKWSPEIAWRIRKLAETNVFYSNCMQSHILTDLTLTLCPKCLFCHLYPWTWNENQTFFSLLVALIIFCTIIKNRVAFFFLCFFLLNKVVFQLWRY